MDAGFGYVWPAAASCALLWPFLCDAGRTWRAAKGWEGRAHLQTGGSAAQGMPLSVVSGRLISSGCITRRLTTTLLIGSAAATAAKKRKLSAAKQRFMP